MLFAYVNIAVLLLVQCTQVVGNVDAGPSAIEPLQHTVSTPSRGRPGDLARSPRLRGGVVSATTYISRHRSTKHIGGGGGISGSSEIKRDDPCAGVNGGVFNAILSKQPDIERPHRAKRFKSVDCLSDGILSTLARPTHRSRPHFPHVPNVSPITSDGKNIDDRYVVWHPSKYVDRCERTSNSITLSDVAPITSTPLPQPCSSDGEGDGDDIDRDPSQSPALFAVDFDKLQYLQHSSSNVTQSTIIQSNSKTCSVSPATRHLADTSPCSSSARGEYCGYCCYLLVVFFVVNQVTEMLFFTACQRLLLLFINHLYCGALCIRCFIVDYA